MDCIIQESDWINNWKYASVFYILLLIVYIIYIYTVSLFLSKKLRSDNAILFVIIDFINKFFIVLFISLHFFLKVTNRLEILIILFSPFKIIIRNITNCSISDEYKISLLKVLKDKYLYDKHINKFIFKQYNKIFFSNLLYDIFYFSIFLYFQLEHYKLINNTVFLNIFDMAIIISSLIPIYLI